MQPIDLRVLSEGDSVGGLIYVQDHNKKPEGSVSKAPIYGTAYFKGKTMAFKIWDSRLQSMFNNNDLQGTILAVSGKVGTYNGKLELTIDMINFDHGVDDTSLFYKTVDVEAVFAQFQDFVNTHLSQKALGVLVHIFKEENLFEPFKVTWAGAKMHDAQVGGLMNHTLKMLKIAQVLLENDQRLKPWSDLVYLAIIFHDIGKVNELGQGGIYTENSFITHRTMGVEILSRHKDAVVAVFGETFYYHILAVQQQHHGKEYGDNPTTVWSEIIHFIDLLESSVTGVLDKIENADYTERNGQNVVWVHGSNLVI